MAVIVTDVPEHTAAGEFTLTVGNGFTVTVPLADTDEQVVLGSVITTL